MKAVPTGLQVLIIARGQNGETNWRQTMKHAVWGGQLDCMAGRNWYEHNKVRAVMLPCYTFKEANRMLSCSFLRKIVIEFWFNVTLCLESWNEHAIL